MALASTVIISANPKSGARSGLAQAASLREALQQRGFAAEMYTDVDAMASRASQCQQARTLRTVVSAGGDGTASLILSKIPSDIPVTLFPLGSENLVASYFEMTRDIDRTVACIERLRTEPLDLFLANGRLTLLVASVGFDAEVVRQVHENRKSHVTRSVYRLGILRAMFSYRWPKFRVQRRDAAGNWDESITANWVFAFNVPRYAAGIRIIDSTSISDGLLDVGMFQGGGLCQGLWNYGMVVRGVHEKSGSWKRFQASGLRISLAPNNTTANVKHEVAYVIVGDAGGVLPLVVLFAVSKAMIVCGSSVVVFFYV
ncbi:MAG: diacylglycerol/lipid kinase family protein, partial [Pirellula sp.]